MYIKKEKTSLVTDGIRRAQLLIGWDRKTANDCGEEKTFRWIISKRNYLRLGCEYTIPYLSFFLFFFEQVYGVFGGGGKGNRYFMEVEETRFETSVDRENVGLSLRLIKCVAQRDIYIYKMYLK